MAISESQIIGLVNTIFFGQMIKRKFKYITRNVRQLVIFEELSVSYE